MQKFLRGVDSFLKGSLYSEKDLSDVPEEYRENVFFLPGNNRSEQHRYVVKKKMDARGIKGGTIDFAYDRKDKKVRVLKSVSDDKDPSLITGEAEALEALRHPNIVTSYGIIKDGDKPYLVLEYLPGGSIQEQIKQGDIPLHQIFVWAKQIAAAIDHVNDTLRKPHRDIKPENMLLTEDGVAKLSDFGSLETVSQSATEFSLFHASPEQLKGKPQTYSPWSDEYSFALSLFDMLTGEYYFQRKTVDGTNLEDRYNIQVARAMDTIATNDHLLDLIPEHYGFPPQVAEQLHMIFEKALHKEPVERYQTCMDLVLSLEHTLRLGNVEPGERS